MLKHCIITRAVFTALALGGTVLLVGCGGLNQQPLAPGATALQGGKAASNDSPAYIFFSQASDPSKVGVRAAKPAAANALSATGLFSPRKDGKLEVKLDDRDDGNGVHVQKSTFEVRKGSIDREVEISMTVYSGSNLEDIGVAFTPSGLTFNPPATLTLALQGDVKKKDLEGLKAYHIHDSTVTQIPIHISSRGKDGLTITLRVPGFSTYSLGD